MTGKPLPPITMEVHKLESGVHKLSWLLVRLMKHQGLTEVELPMPDNAILEPTNYALEIDYSKNGMTAHIKIRPVMDIEDPRGPRLVRPE